MTYEQLDWYDAPKYYDAVFSSLTEAEADFVVAVYERYLSGAPKTLLEPACGSGRLLEALLNRGFEAHGFDLSDAMVEYSRERLAGRKARVWHDRMESFRTRKTFSMAACFVSTFKYLLDDSSAAAHLSRVATALRPGGIYVLGFHLSDYDEDEMDREHWKGTSDTTRITCSIQSWPPDRKSRTERIRARLTAVEGTRRRRIETNWQFRTYSAAQFRALLRKVPELEMIAVHDFQYDIDRTMKLGAEQLDQVVLLRKR